MKAVLGKFAGGPATLVVEETADPVACQGEIVVRIRASGVKYPHTLIVQDRYQFKPSRPFSPGGKLAGIVEATGLGVRQLKVGDRVLGFSTCGAMAEKIALKAKNCAAIPASMPFDEAAALTPLCTLRHGERTARLW